MLFSIFLFTCATTIVDLQAVSLQSLNPFSKEVVEEASSKEYDVDPTGTLTIESEGKLFVQTWKRPRMVITVTKRGTAEQIKSAHVTIKSQPKHTSISSIFSSKSSHASLEYTLMIPEQTTLKAHMNGSIKVMNAGAPVYATSTTDSIKVIQAYSSVHAKAPQGKIKIKQRTLSKATSLFADAYSDVTLLLSRNHNADIHAKALQGKVDIKLFVTLEPITTQLTKETWNRLMKDVHVKLGDGGATITLESTKGSILVNEL